MVYFSCIITNRRKENFEGFYVAGRRLDIFLIFATVAASHTGPAMTLGLSREDFLDGSFINIITSLSFEGQIPNQNKPITFRMLLAYPIRKADRAVLDGQY